MSSKKDKSQLNDINFLKLALSLAKKNEGLTGENPSVGCVIVSDNKIVSTGATSIGGRPHAEANAINNLKGKHKNLIAYMTMEPCTHFGKTPPCTKKIINKKIKKVVYGINDVDPRTAQKAYKQLKSKGIKVLKNVYQNEIKDFYRKYIYVKKNNLPYVIGKIACSNDNYIKSKSNKYLVDENTLKVTHLLRFRNQGILITYKTLNDDNPKLDCRLNGLKKFSPVKFIIDKNLKSKKNSFIFTKGKVKNYIFHNCFNQKIIKSFNKKNIVLIRIKEDKNNNLNLNEILKKIYKLKIQTLLVEGGKKLTKEFTINNLFNEFYLLKSNKNLKNKAFLNISNTIRLLSLNFKNQNLLDTYTNKDKIIRYF